MIELERLNSKVDKFRKYSIYIDDKYYGKIKNNSKEIIECPLGLHTIQLKIDWCKSRKMSVNINENQDVFLICYPRCKGKNFLYTAVSFVVDINNYILIDWK